jgi:hypothetical protein
MKTCYCGAEDVELIRCEANLDELKSVALCYRIAEHNTPTGERCEWSGKHPPLDPHPGEPDCFKLPDMTRKKK